MFIISSKSLCPFDFYEWESWSWLPSWKNNEELDLLINCLCFIYSTFFSLGYYVIQLFSINPITGRVEEKLPNPMEGMTDEQKELEAMKLVNMFDKLSRY